jgi:ribonucleoside-diphosphate reductase alpha chain
MELKDWLNNNELSIDIWNRKYRYNNETLDEWFHRVSGGNDELKQLIKEKKFLFGGRVLANRNTDNSGSYFNCYSSGFCPDDLKGIMQLNT